MAHLGPMLGWHLVRMRWFRMNRNFGEWNIKLWKFTLRLNATLISESISTFSSPILYWRLHCKVFYKHAITNKRKSFDGARDVGLLVSLSGNLFFIFVKVKEYTHIVHCKGSIDTSQCWLNQGTKTLLLSTLECSIPADDKWFKSRVTYSAPLFM